MTQGASSMRLAMCRFFCAPNSSNVSFTSLIGYDFCRYAYCYRMLRYILCHNAICTDCHIAANIHFSNDLCAGTYIHLIANSGTPHSFPTISLSKCYAMTDINVMTNHTVFVNNNASKVANIEAITDIGQNRDTDSISK